MSVKELNVQLSNLKISEEQGVLSVDRNPFFSHYCSCTLSTSLAPLKGDIKQLSMADETQLQSSVDVENLKDESALRVKVQPMKPRIILKQPVLQSLQNKVKNMGRQWLQCNLIDDEDVSWITKRTGPCSNELDPYDFTSFVVECPSANGDTDDGHSFANIYGYLDKSPKNYNRSTPMHVDILNDVNANELASYLDTMLLLPKKMSQMAESMYL